MKTNRKNYNLATPELIAKLVEVGAIPYLTNYRVIVRAKYVDVINPLLTGTHLAPTNISDSLYAIYSKDVCCALLELQDCRTSYGHLEEQKEEHKHTNIKRFTFSDGKTIEMCPECSVSFTTLMKDEQTALDRKRSRVLNPQAPQRLGKRRIARILTGGRLMSGGNH